MRLSKELIDQISGKLGQTGDPKARYGDIGLKGDGISFKSSAIDDAEGDNNIKIASDIIGDAFLFNLLKQTKQVSQIAALSWVNDEIGDQLHDYFRNPGLKDAPPDSRAGFDGHLTKLLTAGGCDDTSNSPEKVLMEKIFEEYELPIFSSHEVTYMYRFKLVAAHVEGSMNEMQGANYRLGDALFEMIVPYPPRPVLEPKNVTEEFLKEWGNEPVLSSNKPHVLLYGKIGDKTYSIYPNNPYVPATCC